MSIVILTVGIVLVAVGLAGLVGFVVVFLSGIMGLDSTEEL